MTGPRVAVNRRIQLCSTCFKTTNYESAINRRTPDLHAPNNDGMRRIPTLTTPDVSHTPPRTISMPATASPTTDVVHVHPDDNVCVAIRNLPTGTQVAAGGATVMLSGA